MPAHHYFTLDGQEVRLAGSMAGANRGDYLLNHEITPPQPMTVTRLNTSFGIWQRVQLKHEVRGLYQTDNRTETVNAWVRI